MDLEKEQLKLKLIETQMMVLRYQHKEITESLNKVQVAQAQIAFDAAKDGQTPSGATKPPDELAGS